MRLTLAVLKDGSSLSCVVLSSGRKRSEGEFRRDVRGVEVYIRSRVESRVEGWRKRRTRKRGFPPLFTPHALSLSYARIAPVRLAIDHCVLELWTFLQVAVRIFAPLSHA